MSKVIYKLVEEDVQKVACEELGRKLSGEELNNIEDAIAEKINWYDAISLAIYEKIKEI